MFRQPEGEEICYQCVWHENCRQRDLTLQDAPSESRGMHPMHYLSSQVAITFHLPELPQQFHLKAFLEPLYFLAWKKMRFVQWMQAPIPRRDCRLGSAAPCGTARPARTSRGRSPHHQRRGHSLALDLMWKILPAEPPASVGAGLVQGVLLVGCFGPILSGEPAPGHTGHPENMGPSAAPITSHLGSSPLAGLRTNPLPG